MVRRYRSPDGSADLPDQVARTLGYRPRSIFYRYLVHQIMWHFRSKTACALCLYSAIPPILAGMWRLQADRLKWRWA